MQHSGYGNGSLPPLKKKPPVWVARRTEDGKEVVLTESMIRKAMEAEGGGAAAADGLAATKDKDTAKNSATRRSSASARARAAGSARDSARGSTRGSARGSAFRTPDTRRRLQAEPEAEVSDGEEIEV